MELPVIPMTSLRTTSGENVLRVLCELEQELSEIEDVRTPVWPREIARKIGRRDGRSVARTLTKLDHAGLVVRTNGGTYRSTPQGRRIDELLAQITFARGGEFAPWSTVPELRDVSMQVALR
jgi:predicted transcriptional regulator